MNDFVKRTADILGISIDNPLLAPRGFDVAEDDTLAEPCVLIMGLNPAGDDGDADRERDLNSTYFYAMDTNSKFDKKWMYNPYFLPIFRFVNAILVGSAKWPWCNKSWQSIEQELRLRNDFPVKEKDNDTSLKTRKSRKEEAIKEIKTYYVNHQHDPKKKFHTIYIGDMFYYHQTDSKKLPLNEKSGGPDYRKYCLEMLMEHIKKLQNEHNKKILFVYINNAKVSHWLCDDNRTWIEVLGIKVFLGGMLSGQRSMDSFSTNRLIAEIQRNMGK